jgi:hypothetical protein
MAQTVYDAVMPLVGASAPPAAALPAEICAAAGCVAVTSRMQQLRPQLGGCYASDPALRDAVILWRERASEQALAALEDVAGLPRRGSYGHSALSILSLWGFSIETRVWEA